MADNKPNNLLDNLKSLFSKSATVQSAMCVPYQDTEIKKRIIPYTEEKKVNPNVQSDTDKLKKIYGF